MILETYVELHMLEPYFSRKGSVEQELGKWANNAVFKSFSRDIVQNALSQSDCRILKSAVSQKLNRCVPTRVKFYTKLGS